MGGPWAVLFQVYLSGMPYRIAFVVAMFLSTRCGLFADTLRMNYSVASEGQSIFQYDFQLILVNEEGLWSAGTSSSGFNWIVFGYYCSGSFGKPLTGFVMGPVPTPFAFGASSVGNCASGVPTLIENGNSVTAAGCRPRLETNWSGLARPPLILVKANCFGSTTTAGDEERWRLPIALPTFLNRDT